MLWTGSERDTAGLPLIKKSHRVPVFYRAENLGKAIKASLDFYRTKARHAKKPAAEARAAQPVTGIDITGKKEGPLGLMESLELLSSFGITTSKGSLAQSPKEAARIADKIGYPVVLKVDSPDLPHKTDLGLVKVGLSSKAEVESAFSDIERKLKAIKTPVSINGVLVQEMISGGTEVIIGIKQEPQLGPALLFGLGGIFTEVMKDFSLRVCPVSRDDVREMIREIKGFKLLEGFRGSPPADIDALEEALLNAARLAMALKDRIKEIDINPLLVLPKGQGVRAIDALLIKG